jgi:hypothetical protein
LITSLQKNIQGKLTTPLNEIEEEREDDSNNSTQIKKKKFKTTIQMTMDEKIIN